MLLIPSNSIFSIVSCFLCHFFQKWIVSDLWSTHGCKHGLQEESITPKYRIISPKLIWVTQLHVKSLKLSSSPKEQGISWQETQQHGRVICWGIILLEASVQVFFEREQ